MGGLPAARRPPNPPRAKPPLPSPLKLGMLFRAAGPPPQVLERKARGGGRILREGPGEEREVNENPCRVPVQGLPLKFCLLHLGSSPLSFDLLLSAGGLASMDEACLSQDPFCFCGLKSQEQV